MSVSETTDKYITFSCTEGRNECILKVYLSVVSAFSHSYRERDFVPCAVKMDLTVTPIKCKKENVMVHKEKSK